MAPPTYAGAALDGQKPQPKRAYSGKSGTVEPCCAKAVLVRCVCRVSWKCEEHGSWCVGSHD